MASVCKRETLGVHFDPAAARVRELLDEVMLIERACLLRIEDRRRDGRPKRLYGVPFDRQSLTRSIRAAICGSETWLPTNSVEQVFRSWLMSAGLISTDMRPSL